MADFVAYECVDAKAYLLDTDLVSTRIETNYASRHSAYNPDSGLIYYLYYYNILRARNVTTRSLTYSASTPSSYQLLPVIVDADGYVWCFHYAFDSIYKYAANLASYTEYLNVANNTLNSISGMALTCDRQYVYVIDNVLNKVAKLDISNPTSAAIWSVSTEYPQSVWVDTDGNVYCQSWQYDGVSHLTKHSSDDGAVVFKIASGSGYGGTGSLSGLGRGFYSNETGYTYNPTNNTTAKWHELNSSGTEVGLTAATPSYFPTSILPDKDENFIYGWAPGYKLMKYAASDWSMAQEEVASTAFGAVSSFLGVEGDPSGYYHNLFSTIPEAAFSGTPRVGNSPLTVTFTDSSTQSPTSWAWDFGDSNTSTDQNPENIYASAGIYTVALTATNAVDSDTETKTDYINVYDGTVANLLDELAIRLNDIQENRFPDNTKLKALNLSQLQIARWLNPEFLQDYEVIESDVDISSGSYALSSLTYNLILEELFAVRVTISETDYWAYPIGIENKELLENEYFTPNESVFWYVFQNTLYVETSSDLSLTGATADIFYLKKPDDCTLYVAPELDAEYHHVLLSLAESYCWSMEDNQSRANAAGGMAKLEMQNLNYRFKEIPQIGV